MGICDDSVWSDVVLHWDYCIWKTSGLKKKALLMPTKHHWLWRRLLEIRQSPFYSTAWFQRGNLGKCANFVWLVLLLCLLFGNNLRTGHTRFTRLRKVGNIGRFESSSTPVCGNTSQNCTGVHQIRHCIRVRENIQFSLLFQSTTSTE